jgi:hypothetical protein
LNNYYYLQKVTDGNRFPESSLDFLDFLPVGKK